MMILLSIFATRRSKHGAKAFIFFWRIGAESHPVGVARAITSNAWLSQWAGRWSMDEILRREKRSSE
jgi:hypothetical protein